MEKTGSERILIAFDTNVSWRQSGAYLHQSKKVYVCMLPELNGAFSSELFLTSICSHVAPGISSENKLLPSPRLELNTRTRPFPCDQKTPVFLHVRVFQTSPQRVSKIFLGTDECRFNSCVPNVMCTFVPCVSFGTKVEKQHLVVSEKRVSISGDDLFPETFNRCFFL